MNEHEWTVVQLRLRFPDFARVRSQSCADCAGPWWPGCLQAGGEILPCWPRAGRFWTGARNKWPGHHGHVACGHSLPCPDSCRDLVAHQRQFSLHSSENPSQVFQPQEHSILHQRARCTGFSWVFWATLLLLQVPALYLVVGSRKARLSKTWRKVWESDLQIEHRNTGTV